MNKLIVVFKNHMLHEPLALLYSITYRNCKTIFIYQIVRYISSTYSDTIYIFYILSIFYVQKY